MNFTKTLLHWYLQNQRELPWRNTTDPYFIWLSEIMLQQTRVAQGLPYYYAFIEAFPTVFDLAAADEQQVLKMWQGLGYYSRARNLHATAKYVAFELGGVFPPAYKELIKLKGVGDYTAAAIASFSYGEKVPVVDGNVFRVLSRFFNVGTDISRPIAKKEFSALSLALMPNDTPALYNQAIMEFGALQCVPKNPDCDTCPLKAGCLALKLNKVRQLPVNNKKQKVSKRYFNYLVFKDENLNTIINKRTQKGIWHNLYEFPLLETRQEESFDVVSQLVVSDNDILSIHEFNEKSIVHKLSHQHLHVKFWEIKVKGSLKNGINYHDAKAFPFPVVLYNFIENHYK